MAISRIQYISVYRYCSDFPPNRWWLGCCFNSSPCVVWTLSCPATISTFKSGSVTTFPNFFKCNIYCNIYFDDKVSITSVYMRATDWVEGREWSFLEFSGTQPFSAYALGMVYGLLSLSFLSPGFSEPTSSQWVTYTVLLQCPVENPISYQPKSWVRFRLHFDTSWSVNQIRKWFLPETKKAKRTGGK